MIPIPDIDGWDRLDETTIVNGDRTAKITFKTMTFAARDNGWMARLWVKDSPHARSEFEDEIVHDDEEAFKKLVRELAERL